MKHLQHGVLTKSRYNYTWFKAKLIDQPYSYRPNITMSINDLEKNASNVLADKITLEPNAQDGYLRRNDVMMFELLFENLLDVYFYIKDKDGRWISCNSTSLQLLNLTDVSDIIGAKEESFFPKKIAHDICQDDLKILDFGESVLNRVELITDSYGDLIWVNTNKLPIFNSQNNVIGIIGVTKPIIDQNSLPQKYELFSEIIDFIRANLSKTILIAELAKVSNLSESQFRRKFRIEFGVSPQEFILRARLQSAAHLLRNNSCNISQVASQSGFSDQSYFTRQFKTFFAETPKDYRKSRR